MAESDTPMGRPSLAVSRLNADQRAELQVLRASTETSAPLYRANWALLVAAKERYHIQVCTEEIATELSANGTEHPG